MTEYSFNYYWLSPDQLEKLRDKFIHNTDREKTMKFDAGLRVRMHVTSPTVYAKGLDQTLLYKDANVKVTQKVYEEICDAIEKRAITMNMNSDAERAYNNYVEEYKTKEKKPEHYEQTLVELCRKRSAMNILGMRPKQ